MAEKLAGVHFETAPKLQKALHYIIFYVASEGKTLPNDKTIEAGLKR